MNSWEHTQHLSAQNSSWTNETVNRAIVNIGVNHTWLTLFCDGDQEKNIMDGHIWISEYLKLDFYGKFWDDKPIILPTNEDGSSYELKDTTEDQQIFVNAAMESTKNLPNEPMYKHSCEIIMGCCGTVKYNIIRTTLTMIRGYT